MTSDIQRRPDKDDRQRKYKRRWKQKASGSRSTDMFLKEGRDGAGQVGSAPTFDVGKQPKKPKRVEVTKNAAFEAGVKLAFTAAQGVGAALTGSLGVLAIYDLVKARGHDKDVEKVRRAITSGTLVNSRKFVNKIDPKIKIFSTRSDIKQALSREPLIKPRVATALAASISSQIMSGRNAFAMPGERGDYIFAPERTSAQVLGHEVGHILDFRKKSINIRRLGPYEETFWSSFWKPTHEQQVMGPERRAWRMSPERKRPGSLERAALGSYEKSFHGRRGAMSGVTAMALGLGTALLKSAEMTSGESERDTSAPGVSGQRFSGHMPEERSERGPGNQGQKGRGVPEWLRMLKYLPGSATQNSGDKTGPQKTDNQYETPKTASRR